MRGRFFGTTMYIHAFFGVACLSFTGVFAVKAWSLAWNWDYSNSIGIVSNYHSLFVFPVLWLILFVVLGGVMARSIMNRAVWDTRRALRFRMCHRIIAYFVLLSGLCAIATGIYQYRTYPSYASDFPLEWVHISCFVLILGSMEMAW